jgi:hypothetical protein
MSPQTPNITNTPQQIAEAVATARDTASFATGRVVIAILVHNEDNEVLLRNTFNIDRAPINTPPLALHHILSHEIDLQPFTADGDAGISLRSLTEDAIIAKLGIVDITNMTVLHVCVDEAHTATVVPFVACSIASPEVPDAFMRDFQWLPESVLQNADLQVLTALLGAEGIGNLLRAREHWKLEVTSLLHAIPDLVSSLPFAPARTGEGGDVAEAEEDSGYQPDSESSSDSDEVRDISDVDEDYTLQVEHFNADLPDLVPSDPLVFGDETLTKSNTAKSQHLSRYRASEPRRRFARVHSAEDPETDDDDDDLDFPKKKDTSRSEKAGRRVFHLDPALTRGSRVPRKQQRAPPLLVDPAYLHQGPRFARPAQKVDGRRFGTKINRSHISLATDKAITESRVMWDDLPKVSPEMRLV